MRIVVVADFAESYNRRVLHGAALFASLHGWTLEPHQVRGSADLTHVQEAADGLLLGTHRFESSPLLLRTHLPAVSWSATLPRAPWPRVLSDDRAVGRAVAEHFHSHGLRRFAFYSDVTGTWATNRLTGFAASLHAAGYDVDTGPRLSAGRREKTIRWLARLPVPLGVMVVHDPAAMAVLAACRALGRRVPEDVAVVGVNNDDLMVEITDPPLSAVPLRTDRIGYESAAMLAQMLEGRRPANRIERVQPGDLVVRRSSDMLAFDDARMSGALRFIREGLATGVNSKQVIAHVGVCRATLDTLFRSSLGSTVAAEIRRLRIARTRQLLGTSDVPMPAVARLAGFSCARQLSETFRHVTGQTPTEYRRQVRGMGSLPAKAPPNPAAARSLRRPRLSARPTR